MSTKNTTEDQPFSRRIAQAIILGVSFTLACFHIFGLIAPRAIFTLESFIFVLAAFMTLSRHKTDQPAVTGALFGSIIYLLSNQTGQPLSLYGLLGLYLFFRLGSIIQLWAILADYLVPETQTRKVGTYVTISLFSIILTAVFLGLTIDMALWNITDFRENMVHALLLIEFIMTVLAVNTMADKKARTRRDGWIMAAQAVALGGFIFAMAFSPNILGVVVYMLVNAIRAIAALLPIYRWFVLEEEI